MSTTAESAATSVAAEEAVIASSVQDNVSTTTTSASAASSSAAAADKRCAADNPPWWQFGNRRASAPTPPTPAVATAAPVVAPVAGPVTTSVAGPVAAPVTTSVVAPVAAPVATSVTGRRAASEPAVITTASTCSSSENSAAATLEGGEGEEGPVVWWPSQRRGDTTGGDDVNVNVNDDHNHGGRMKGSQGVKCNNNNNNSINITSASVDPHKRQCNLSPNERKRWWNFRNKDNPNTSGDTTTNTKDDDDDGMPTSRRRRGSQIYNVPIPNHRNSIIELQIESLEINSLTCSDTSTSPKQDGEEKEKGGGMVSNDRSWWSFPSSDGDFDQSLCIDDMGLCIDDMGDVIVDEDNSDAPPDRNLRNQDTSVNSEGIDLPHDDGNDDNHDNNHDDDGVSSIASSEHSHRFQSTSKIKSVIRGRRYRRQTVDCYASTTTAMTSNNKTNNSNTTNTTLSSSLRGPPSNSLFDSFGWNNSLRSKSLRKSAVSMVDNNTECKESNKKVYLSEATTTKVLPEATPTQVRWSASLRKSLRKQSSVSALGSSGQLDTAACKDANREEGKDVPPKATTISSQEPEVTIHQLPRRVEPLSKNNPTVPKPKLNLRASLLGSLWGRSPRLGPVILGEGCKDADAGNNNNNNNDQLSPKEGENNNNNNNDDVVYEVEVLSAADKKCLEVVESACRIMSDANSSTVAMGMEAPFRPVDETFPSLRKLHRNLEYQTEELGAVTGLTPGSKSCKARRRKKFTRKNSVSSSLTSSVGSINSVPPTQLNHPDPATSYILDQMTTMTQLQQESTRSLASILSDNDTTKLHTCYLPNFMWYQLRASDPSPSSMIRPTSLCSGTGIAKCEHHYLDPDMLNVLSTFRPYLLGSEHLFHDDDDNDEDGEDGSDNCGKEDRANHRYAEGNNKRRSAFWVEAIDEYDDNVEEISVASSASEEGTGEYDGNLEGTEEPTNEEGTIADDDDGSYCDERNSLQIENDFVENMIDELRCSQMMMMTSAM